MAADEVAAAAAAVDTFARNGMVIHSVAEVVLVGAVVTDDGAWPFRASVVVRDAVGVAYVVGMDGEDEADRTSNGMDALVEMDGAAAAWDVACSWRLWALVDCWDR